MLILPDTVAQVVSFVHMSALFFLLFLPKLFDFRAPGDVGRCVCYHPHLEVFASGSQEGVVRIFHIPTTTVLAEHR